MLHHQAVEELRELVEIAIELQKANAQVGGIGEISCGTRQNNPNESKRTQSVWFNYRPRCKLPRLAHRLIIFMYSEICPCFPIQRSLKRREYRVQVSSVHKHSFWKFILFYPTYKILVTMHDHTSEIKLLHTRVPMTKSVPPQFRCIDTRTVIILPMLFQISRVSLKGVFVCVCVFRDKE